MKSFEKPTILTLSQYSDKITIKLEPGCSISDLIHAFYTACIGITFNHDTIINGLKEYIEYFEEEELEKKKELKKELQSEQEQMICDSVRSVLIKEKEPTIQYTFDAPNSNQIKDPFVQNIAVHLINKDEDKNTINVDL